MTHASRAPRPSLAQAGRASGLDGDPPGLERFDAMIGEKKRGSVGHGLIGGLALPGGANAKLATPGQPPPKRPGRASLRPVTDASGTGNGHSGPPGLNALEIAIANEGKSARRNTQERSSPRKSLAGHGGVVLPRLSNAQEETQASATSASGELLPATKAGQDLVRLPAIVQEEPQKATAKHRKKKEDMTDQEKKERKRQKKKEQEEFEAKMEAQREAYQNRGRRSSQMVSDNGRRPALNRGRTSELSGGELESLMQSIARSSVKECSHGDSGNEDAREARNHSKMEDKLFAQIDEGGSSSKPAAVNRTGVAATDADGEGHVDKRLLMVRNARLIQQLLQEIPDESTRCHDKWLKKAAAAQPAVEQARSPNRISAGRPFQERMEMEIKKTSQRLRRQRREAALHRLGQHGVDGIPCPEAPAGEGRTRNGPHGARASVSKRVSVQRQSQDSDSASDSDSSLSSSSSSSSSSSNNQIRFSTGRISEEGPEDSEQEEADEKHEASAAVTQPAKSATPSSIDVAKPDLRFPEVLAAAKDLQRRLTTAPPKVSAQLLQVWPDLGQSQEVEKTRPATTGLLHQWLDLSSKFRELQQACTNIKMEPLPVLDSSVDSKPASPKTTSNSGVSPSSTKSRLAAYVSPLLDNSFKEAFQSIHVAASTTAEPASSKDKEASDDESSTSSGSSVFEGGMDNGGEELHQQLNARASTITHSESRRSRIKLPEIARLRTKFHDQRRILGDSYRFPAQTVKRYHLDAAERLGLGPDDWDVTRIYQMNVDDLVRAAELKETKKLEKAAAQLQVQWRLMMFVRKVRSDRKRRREALLRIQRWWHRLINFVRPIRERCARRPIIQDARARIGAAVLGWWVRKKMLFQLHCHSVRWKMDELQKDLGRDDVERWVRVQAHIRGFLSRQDYQRKLIERRHSVDTIPKPLEFESVCSASVKFASNPLEYRSALSSAQSSSSASTIRQKRVTIQAPSRSRQSSSSGRASLPADNAVPDGFTLQESSRPARAEVKRRSKFQRRSLSSVPRPAPDPGVAVLEAYCHKKIVGCRIVDSVPFSVRRQQPLNIGLAKLGGLRPSPCDDTKTAKSALQDDKASERILSDASDELPEPAEETVALREESASAAERPLQRSSKRKATGFVKLTELPPEDEEEELDECNEPGCPDSRVAQGIAVRQH